MKQNTRGEWLLVLSTFVLVAVVWAFIFDAKRSCERDGGRYLRGVFWFECVR